MPAESDAWKAQPPYNWAPIAKGKGLGFITPALAKDTIMAGPSSLDLWLKSNRKDTDLQATITEVRPDGAGDLGPERLAAGFAPQAQQEAVEPDRSVPDPPQEGRGAAAASKKFSLVRIPIFPAAHAFRAGSKIRVTVSAVGGDRPIWDFARLTRARRRTRSSIGGKKPSKLVLPMLKGADAQGTPLPPAKSLRGQPGRTYEKASNGG